MKIEDTFTLEEKISTRLTSNVFGLLLYVDVLLLILV
jgi:hypothetical protein